MKHTIYILLLTFVLGSCIKHDKKKVRLYGFENQKEIKYEDGKAIFYLGLNDYRNYLKEKENKKSLYNGYRCIIDYIENSEGNPILISDSLRLAGSRKEIYQNGNDTIEKIIDVYPSDNLRWAIIDFAKKGNLKIFYKKDKMFLENIIVDEIKYPNSVTVVIKLENKIEIFDQLRWAN